MAATPTGPLFRTPTSKCLARLRQHARHLLWLACCVCANSASGNYGPLIDEAASLHGIDASLVRSVIQIESGFNATALSPKGAAGLMQLMPHTARMYGVANVFDPAENIQAGTKHLAGLLRQFDQNVPLALAAYNAGAQAVVRAGNRVPDYPETRNYVERVVRRHRDMASPRTHASAARLM